ncbi:hypothetical protein ES703_65906 [subsurface metagenome]
MRKIRVIDLKAGMKFDKAVYIEGENILVPAEISIRQKDIDRLTRWEIEEVQTEGSEINEQAEDLSEQFKQTTAWLPIREEKYLKFYRTVVEKVDRIFLDIVEGTTVSHDPIDSVVSDLIEILRQGKNEMIQLILIEEWVERRLSAGAINCTVIASIIGHSLKLVGHRLLHLTTGALLHDVGMLRISKKILKKEGKLTPDELNQVKTHPILGYRIISKELKFPEEIASIALQHHEHWDGKGYPRSLKGEDISLSARVVAVADSYEAMVSERPYRSPIIGYSAMKNILSDNGKYFDPKVLKAFLESMGVFPIGSIVQLNNSSIGRVVDNHIDAPLRPKIEIFIDEYGAKITEMEIVDLLMWKNLFIVKAIDPKVIGVSRNE